MKKISILVIFAALFCLQVNQIDAITVKGIDVNKLTQVPGRIKDIFKAIKEIVDSTRGTINTIEKEIEHIKIIQYELNLEKNLAQRMVKGRELVKPSRLMLENTLSTIQLFIQFADNHLDELVRIFDKEAGQKVEDFITQKLKPIVEESKRTLIGVLTALEPNPATIAAIEDAKLALEDAKREKEAALAIQEQAQKELAEAKAMTREAIRIREERAAARGLQESAEDILEESELQTMFGDE